jgi:hypothetical protein
MVHAQVSPEFRYMPPGVLKRFSLRCIGPYHPTEDDITTTAVTSISHGPYVPNGCGNQTSSLFATGTIGVVMRNMQRLQRTSWDDVLAMLQARARSRCCSFDFFFFVLRWFPLQCQTVQCAVSRALWQPATSVRISWCLRCQLRSPALCCACLIVSP